MMEPQPNFIYFSRGDNTRLAGKMQVHHRLAFDEERGIRGYMSLTAAAIAGRCQYSTTAYTRRDSGHARRGSHLRHAALCADGRAIAPLKPRARGAIARRPAGFTSLKRK